MAGAQTEEGSRSALQTMTAAVAKMASLPQLRTSAPRPMSTAAPRHRSIDGTISAGWKRRSRRSDREAFGWGLVVPIWPLFLSQIERIGHGRASAEPRANRRPRSALNRSVDRTPVASDGTSRGGMPLSRAHDAPHAQVVVKLDQVGAQAGARCGRGRSRPGAPPGWCWRRRPRPATTRPRRPCCGPLCRGR